MPPIQTLQTRPVNTTVPAKTPPLLFGTVNLAVLLLSCNDTPRVTTLTRESVKRIMRNVADYVFAQSGGRATLAYHVLDWYELPLSSAQWNALAFGAGPVVKPLVAAGLQVDLDGYDQFALVIDKGDAFSAATFGDFIHAAAADFTPAIMQHELTHVFGAADAFLDDPMGPIVYGDRFDIMGGEGSKYSFAEPSLVTEPGANRRAMSGPGMTAPTLIATGWLDPFRGGIGRDMSASIGHWGVELELSALRGAPAPDWAGPPVCAWFDVGEERFIIEYRTRDAGGWDRALPAHPGSDAAGWIVVHRTPLHGAITTLQVAVLPGAHGESWSAGKDDPFDIFSPGPVKLSVRGFDRARGTVNLFLNRRQPWEPHGGISFGGLRQDGDGLVWTPGRGFTPVPPHSPVVAVLERVAQLQQLQTLVERPADAHTEPLTEAAGRSLATLKAEVARLETVAASAPLEEVSSGLGNLRELQQRLTSSNGDGIDPAVLAAAISSLAKVQRSLDRVAADHAARLAVAHATKNTDRDAGTAAIGRDATTG